ncbi:RNI-like protein [Lichtheimia hyalospora FSU 10163]|nr:RNI-like protein [Lichtheimia hyalospora FSU 10163]
MITEESLLSGLTLQGPKCLRFPNAVLERIFGMLPTQRDLRETCLVDRSWTMAAMNVLWRQPQFAGPVAFRSFLQAIHKNKQTALRVRDLNLCISDHQHIVTDGLPRVPMRIVQQSHATHAQCPLASPQIIFAVLQQCEMVDTLSLYGWHLQSTHLRLIASHLPRLKSICIIGSPQSNGQQPTIATLPLLPVSVTRIQLFGNYILHPSRYPALESLRLSMANTTQTGIDKICQGGLTTLRVLTLANAIDIQDDHLCQLLDAFPNLQSFSVEDGRFITGQGIISAIKKAQFLTDLMIQQHPDAAKKHHHSSPIYQQYDHMVSNHMTFNLCSITLTHIHIEDHQLCQLLEPSLTQLEHVYLSGCPQITNEFTLRLLQHATRLESLTIIHCKGVGAKTIQVLKDSSAIHNLRSLTFNGNGFDLQPVDILDFVRSAASHHLEYLTLRGYHEIMNAPFISRHVHSYRHARFTDDTLTFDRDGILGLAKEAYTPEDRMVTGKELMELANALNMEVVQLEMLMENIKKNLEQHHLTTAQDFIQSTTTDETPKSNTSLSSEGTEHAMHDTEFSEDTDPTSYTSPEPASTVEEHDSHESLTKHLDSTIVQSSPQQQQDNILPSDENIHRYDEPTIVSSTANDLGGWGSTLDISWKSRSSFGSRSFSDSSSNGSSSVSGHAFTAAAVDYEHAWRQVAKEAPIITAKRVPMADDRIPDGWGTPKQVVEWDDTRLAYAHDVVEKQKSTTFWIKRDDGNWIKAADKPPVTTTTSTTMATATAATTPRPHRTRTEPSARSNRRMVNTEIQKRNTSMDIIRSEVSERWADFAAGRPSSQQIPDLINLGTKEDDLFSIAPTIPIPTSSKSMQLLSSSSASSPSSELNRHHHHAKDDLDESLH